MLLLQALVGLIDHPGRVVVRVRENLRADDGYGMCTERCFDHLGGEKFPAVLTYGDHGHSRQQDVSYADFPKRQKAWLTRISAAHLEADAQAVELLIMGTEHHVLQPLRVVAGGRWRRPAPLVEKR